MKLVSQYTVSDICVILKFPNQFDELNKHKWTEFTLETTECSLIERVALSLHKFNLLTVSKRNLQKKKKTLTLEYEQRDKQTQTDR